MRAPEVEQFLTHLATDGHVSASTQNQALNALVFLYGRVLDIDLGRIERAAGTARQTAAGRAGTGRGRQRTGVRRGGRRGVSAGGVLSLAVQDINLERQAIHVRAGKGDKDRIVMLPKSIRAAGLEELLAKRKELHNRDLQRGPRRVAGRAGAEVPAGGARVRLAVCVRVAADVASPCPRTVHPGRHHIYEASLQRAVGAAGAAAGLDKRVHCHTFRHSPLDLLDDLNADEVRAAVEATRTHLAGRRRNRHCWWRRDALCSTFALLSRLEKKEPFWCNEGRAALIDTKEAPHVYYNNSCVAPLVPTSET